MTYDLCLGGVTLPRMRPVMRVGPVLSSRSIRARVADYYRISVDDLLSQRRGREVARPRQVAMYLCRQLTPLSLPNIGRKFGHRDHTTVIHAIKTVERLMETDGDFAEDVAAIREALAA